MICSVSDFVKRELEISNLRARVGFIESRINLLQMMVESLTTSGSLLRRFRVWRTELEMRKLKQEKALLLAKVKELEAQG